MERQFAEFNHLPVGSLFGPWDKRIKKARQMNQLVDKGYNHFLQQRLSRLQGERDRFARNPREQGAQRASAVMAEYGRTPPAPAHTLFPPSHSVSSEERQALYYRDAKARYQRHMRDQADRQRIHGYHPYPLKLSVWQYAERKAHTMTREEADSLRDRVERGIGRQMEDHYRQQRKGQFLQRQPPVK